MTPLHLPRRTLPRRALLATGLLGALGLGASACGGADRPGSGGSDGAGADGTAGGGGSAGVADGFPLELDNCAEQLLLEAPPQRVVLLESSPVTLLEGIGVLDRVVARAGSFPTEYFTPELAARLEAIPALSEELDATGHLQINQEVVIAQQPDLVIGLPDGITREGLRGAGAEVLVPRTFCGQLPERASFEDLFAEITTYGRLFDRTVEAEALTSALQERIEAVRAGSGERTASTAAVLYPSVGGGPLYTYGSQSMATAQLEALGLVNAFGDTAERVFEISAEPLLAADPDVLIVLYQGETTGEEAIAEVTGAERLGGLRAVTEQAVLPLLFNVVEPASPLTVDGLEQIADWLDQQATI